VIATIYIAFGDQQSRSQAAQAVSLLITVPCVIIEEIMVAEFSFASLLS
jgi:hypothetical protein